MGSGWCCRHLTCFADDDNQAGEAVASRVVRVINNLWVNCDDGQVLREMLLCLPFNSPALKLIPHRLRVSIFSSGKVKPECVPAHLSAADDVRQDDCATGVRQKKRLCGAQPPCIYLRSRDVEANPPPHVAKLSGCFRRLSKGNQAASWAVAPLQSANSASWVTDSAQQSRPSSCDRVKEAGRHELVHAGCPPKRDWQQSTKVLSSSSRVRSSPWGPLRLTGRHVLRGARDLAAWLTPLASCLLAASPASCLICSTRD